MDEYSRELHTSNQNHLISLRQDRDDLQQRVALLERKKDLLRDSISVLQTEIASCKVLETGYTTQITALSSKMPPAGKKSEAFMMHAHFRLGGNNDCEAIKSNLDIQKDNCQTLVTMVRTMLKMDPSLIIEKVDSAWYVNRTSFTAEDGVSGTMLAIGVVDKGIEQTLRHVLFSAEFKDRSFQERREIPVIRGVPT
jgi:hypothetical protein